jgi:hypothetical protein
MIRQQIRNEVLKVIPQAQADPNADKFGLVAKLLNVRDNLHRQVFHSCLYRKLLIWNDLNIQCDEYSHQRVVDCFNEINDFQEKFNYKPTKLAFKEVTIETPGYFSLSEASTNEKCEATDTMDAMIQNYIDMENLIKKNFMVQSEKLDKFAKNNPIQMTLREEIEEVNQELNKMKELNRQLNLRAFN